MALPTAWRASVGPTTPTRLDANTGDGADSATTKQSVEIRNRGTSAVYLGGSAVTAATGFQLDPGESRAYDFIGFAPLYAISGAGATNAVHVFEISGS